MSASSCVQGDISKTATSSLLVSALVPNKHDKLLNLKGHSRIRQKLEQFCLVHTVLYEFTPLSWNCVVWYHSSSCTSSSLVPGIRFKTVLMIESHIRSSLLHAVSVLSMKGRKILEAYSAKVRQFCGVRKCTTAGPSSITASTSGAASPGIARSSKQFNSRLLFEGRSFPN